jgi:hypothetical protein
MGFTYSGVGSICFLTTKFIKDSIKNTTSVQYFWLSIVFFVFIFKFDVFFTIVV